MIVCKFNRFFNTQKFFSQYISQASYFLFLRKLYILNLVIDIGNTSFKIGVFNLNELIYTDKINFNFFEKINNLVKDFPISKTILSNVRSENDDIFKIIKKFKPLILDAKTPMPIKLNYNTPETLGSDRIASVVAAASLYKGKNIAIFDVGTCITIDVVNNKNEYLGGRISPGLKMRFMSLNNYTEALPLCNIVNDDKFLGKSTISSIISGVQKGVISEVKDFICEFRKENKDNLVIFTGGDCFFFEKKLKSSIFANPNLVLIGLNEILKFNE